MGSRSEIGRAAVLVAALVAVLAPNGAEAAKVVNGDFESGTLSGWNVQRATEAGNWFAYKGTDAPIGSKRPKPADPVQPPPQGTFAAIADQANPDALILYQDVALEAGFAHQLRLLAYYDSYASVAVPNPDTLSVDEEALRLPNGDFQKNQQFRIDVMKPEAPLESLNPADILRTVFATKPGDPPKMAPRSLTADLSAFAGQTVRIRIADAATEEVFNAGVDAVAISTFAPGQSPPLGGQQGPALFSFGGLVAARSKGTATLRIRVSGPGLLRAKSASTATGLSAGSRPKMLPRSIEPVTIPIAVAKTVMVHLRPTPAARAVLRKRHMLRTKVLVNFMPVGSSAEAAVLPVVFRLADLSK